MRKWSICLLLLCLLGAAVAFAAMSAAPNPVSLEKADRYYREGSYAKALPGYEQALASGTAGDRKNELEYRVLVSLGRTQRWGDAFDRTEAFLREHPTGLWGARGQHWLGQLYLLAPHHGYRVGGRLYRGENYPKVAGAEKPEQVWLWDEDREKGRASFERAKERYEATKPRPVAEEAYLNFDLARVLGGEDLTPLARVLQALAKEKQPGLNLRLGEPEKDEVARLRGHDWKPAPAARYVPSLPGPQRVQALYRQIERLDPVRAPQARLARALYLRQYQEQMRELMRAYDTKKGNWVALPFPYQQVDPVALLRSIGDDFPNRDLAPQAQYLAGQWLESQGKFVKALEVYRVVVRRWPKSKWVSDARAHIQAIEWPSLNLNVQSTPPGNAVKIRLGGRNVKTVSFRARAVDLEKLILAPALLNDPRVSLGDFPRLAAALERGKWQGSRPAASWTYVTRDKGGHEFLSEEVKAPLRQRGAYVITADAGEAHASTLLLISDLAIVEKTDRDRTLVFVCDARTGAPVPGAQVVMKETWRDSRRAHSDVDRGPVDADGLRGKRFVSPRGGEVNAFAWVGDRYAITPSMGGGGRQSRRPEYRGYVTTDRPVYRPGHQVQFRVVIGVRTVEGEDLAGGWRAAKGEPVEVTVLDPRGAKAHQATLTTSEFGTINGGFLLGAEPPLGIYRVQVRVPKKHVEPLYQISGNLFRVEEYRKPEFEVTVTPAAEQIRVGEEVKADLTARYYFGSPVVGGQVKYRIFKMPYTPHFEFPRPYDWLTRYWEDGRPWDYERSYEGGEVVKEGEGTTDDEGRLALTIPTAGGGRWPEAKAYTYTVSAEVTDPSRRTITGTGAVRASTQRFFAFLDVPFGFYEVGDRIELEVATRDVMDRPTAATGRVRVERVVRGAGPKGEDVVEALAHEEEVATDSEGRAFFRWTPKNAGNYRFTFAATDEWGAKVEGRAYTWVAGPDSDRVTFRHHGIEIIPQQRTYQEGETCRLLVLSTFPDVTVLLTQEAGRQILAKSVLPVKAKAQIVEVKLTRGHAPNFTFSAIALHDWQAFDSAAEVFVPPAPQFLDVSVSADRETYRPGEVATFHIRAADHRGKPVRTELSLGVIDASVLYIQQDFAPDPRLAFYGERRWTDVPRTWSREWEPEPISRTDRTAGKYALHEWRPPKGMGQIETWPVDVVGNSGWGDFDEGYVTLDAATLAARPDPLLTFAPPPPALPEQRVTLPAVQTWARIGAPPLSSVVSQAGARHLPSPKGPAGLSGQLAEAQVRTRFADTAFWGPAIITNDKGEATVKVTMPENLTTWRATARGVTTEFQVGQGSGEAVTRKNLIVRLQAPRFFMERDLVALSANVHNYLKSEKQVKVTLALDGGTVEVVTDPPASLGLTAAREPSVWVTVPKDGERRVDWVVRVLRSGTASVRMAAQSDEESDAMEMQFPALVHGVEKFVAQSGVMRDVKGTQTAMLSIDLPKERQRGASTLNVQLTPSLAAVALDALPYLVDYPYGCIEQTMSRFLPTVVAARTLTDLGVDLDELHRRAEAQASQTTEAKSYGASAYTYPKGQPGGMNAAELASRMYLRRGTGPVFDRKQMDRMARDGLSRIYGQQHEDGGWGWWPDDVSDPYMSAYVVYGLFTAREAGYEIDNNVLERGFKFLIRAMKEHGNLHRVAYLASVVTLRGSVDDGVRKAIAVDLYADRGRLTAYSQALLALALKQLGETGKARVVVDNLENTATTDRENGTANWMPRQRGWWWHWWDNPIETNAAALRAYLAVEPDSDLVPMIVKWLVNNRRGNHWQSTKETALAVYALADFIRVKKELAPDYTITVDLGGKVQRTYRVNRENALLFDNRFIVGDEVLGDGSQPLTITVNGRGTLYYSAYLSYFSREEDVTGAGNEIFVQRRYFRLTPRLVEKKEKDRTWRELTYDREELRSGAALKSGDLIEVELVLDARNDYEYVVFEDMKPAGCEPVEVRSGAGEGAGVYSQMELRDEKVAFFISDLPQGTRAVRYRLRAEIPGVFHALPTNGYSMYAPDVRCLSNEWRASVAN